MGLLCLVAVSSAPARSIRGHSHSHSYASKLNRCKCFAVKLANYLKLAKVEIKHMTEQIEDLMEEIEELSKCKFVFFPYF